MLDVLSEKITVRSRISPESVLKLGIVGSKVPPDIHIFRVHGWEHSVYVDAVVKDALSEFPHEGLAFIPIEQE